MSKAEDMMLSILDKDLLELTLNCDIDTINVDRILSMQLILTMKKLISVLIKET